jgi:hypothetical protein
MRLAAVTVLACACAAPPPPDVAAIEQALAACDALAGLTTPEGRIVRAECREAGGGLPRHLWVLGCVDCEGAVYSPTTHLLTNGGELPATPTSWVLRVADSGWNGRALAVVGGRTTTHMFFAPFQAKLMAAGFAVINVNHPMPGHPEIPLGFAGYDPLAMAGGYIRAGAAARATLATVGPVARLYGYGTSRGVLAAMGLILDREDAPYDGYIIGSGGDGFLPRLRLSQQIVVTPDAVQPCTGGPTDNTGQSPEAIEARLLGDVHVVEPDYDGTGLDYRVEDRPREVQETWARMQVGADLARPTVVLHGQADRLIPSLLAVKHAVRVVRAGKGDLLRLYFLRTRGHGQGPIPQAQPSFADDTYFEATLHLDAWVHGGAWPADDTITERLATEAPAFEARSQTSCGAVAPDASWAPWTCADDPYKWGKDELQECPAADHPKVTSCAPWRCYLEVLRGG